MKCENCDIQIDAKFKSALESNKCPACGEHIMESARLASYLSLKSLLDRNVSEKIDSDGLANLIVANFELKQIFNSEGQDKVAPPTSAKTKKRAPSVVVEEDTVAVEEELTPDEAYDEEYKANQMAGAKEKLKQMREEAYNGAVMGQFGWDETPTSVSAPSDVGIDAFGEESPHERVNRLKAEQRRDNMLSGAGGFSRSDG